MIEQEAKYGPQLDLVGKKVKISLPEVDAPGAEGQGPQQQQQQQVDNDGKSEGEVSR